jgi:hypothetical protein
MLTKGGTRVGAGTVDEAGGQAKLNRGVNKGLHRSTQLRVDHIEPHSCGVGVAGVAHYTQRGSKGDEVPHRGLQHYLASESRVNFVR